MDDVYSIPRDTINRTIEMTFYVGPELSETSEIIIVIANNQSNGFH
jgi:hypothetical protein